MQAFLPGRNNNLHKNSTKKKLTVLQFYRTDRWLRNVHKLSVSQQQPGYRKGVYYRFGRLFHF